MNIVSKQDLQSISFDILRMTQVDGYRRYDVAKDGVATTYYYPVSQPDVTTIEAIDGTITTRTVQDALHSGEVLPVSALQQQTLDIPHFMKRRHEQQQQYIQPTKHKRTDAQERTFAWWMNQVTQD